MGSGGTNSSTFGAEERDGRLNLEDAVEDEGVELVLSAPFISGLFRGHGWAEGLPSEKKSTAAAEDGG